MRNIRLIALFFLNLIFIETKVIAEKKDFWEKCSGNFFLESNLDLEVIGGGKISSPFSEVCFYKNTDKLDFGISTLHQSKLENLFFDIKYGNLIFSKSISKLHNPLISNSVSPFEILNLNESTIGATLPGINSSAHSKSVFLSSEYRNSKNILQDIKLTGFYIPTDKAGLNSLIKLKNKNTILSFSATNELFSASTSPPATWFSKDLYGMKDFYFHEVLLFDSLNQIFYTGKHLSSLITVELYESPFGKLNTIFKSENKLKQGKFLFQFSGLINRNQIYTLTGSGKKIDDCIQGKCGGQYQFTLKRKIPYFIKIGFNTYYKYDLIPDSNDVELKISCGEQITTPLYRLAIIYNNDWNLKKNASLYWKCNTQIKNFWYLKKITAGIQCDFSYEKKGNTNSTVQNVKIYSNFWENPKITLNINCTFLEKNHTYEKCTFGFSITGKYIFNRIGIQTRIKDDF